MADDPESTPFGVTDPDAVTDVAGDDFWSSEDDGVRGSRELDLDLWTGFSVWSL